MKIHTQNATTLLFEKIKSLTVSHDSWRAIYFNFSDHKEQYSDGLRTNFVVKIIKELLADEEGNVYLCEDQDIVLLFQGAAKPIIAKLGENFEGLKSENITIQPEDNLFSVFDLSHHWQIFFNLCKAKALQQQNVSVQATQTAPPSAPSPAPKSIEPDGKLFQAAAAKRPIRKKLLVLAVEDDAFTRKLVTGVIKEDFDIVEAGTGAEAIAAYSLHAPDLVFLDIELPDISGQVVLQKLVALDPNAFIVMLSGSSFKENILAALEVGAQGFVTKPFAKEKLMHYLNLCTGLRRGEPPSARIRPVPLQEAHI